MDDFIKFRRKVFVNGRNGQPMVTLPKKKIGKMPLFVEVRIKKSFL